MFWSSAAFAGGAVVYPTFIEPWRVQINHIPIRVPGLPRSLDGFTIAHMTDLHRSRFVSAEYLTACVVKANALEPDLIVFTGDYLTYGRSRHGQLIYGASTDGAALVRDVAQCMGSARARYGVFASLGNHDHWFDAKLVTRTIEAAGIPVLRNAHAGIRVNGTTLPVVGLGDLWTEGVNLSRAFAGVDAPFALVLMHNPDGFEKPLQPGAQLILAGHTHGGQVNLPFIGPPIVPSQFGAKYAHGLFQKADAQMYVNRGLGLIYPPVRFNCRPEIAVLHLKCA